jgi:hypothetical protein
MRHYRHNSECRVIPSVSLEGATNAEGFADYCSA